ncbi:MAG: hypothetical protein ACR2HR_00180 [Euzebya sp.]
MQDLGSAGLGVVALILGGLAILGVVRPQGGGAPQVSVAVQAVLGVIVGVVGLFIGRTRGIGRQLAIVGTGVALIGLALFGGGVALEALLESTG